MVKLARISRNADLFARELMMASQSIHDRAVHATAWTSPRLANYRREPGLD
jgi:hypothetical protein